jgi:hypothetical protein
MSHRIQLRDCTLYFKDGLSGTGLSAKKTNEKQSVVLDAGVSAGTFTLTYSTQETSDIPFNATAAQVKSALEGLAAIGEDNVSVTGSAKSWVVEFIGALGHAHIADMTGDGTNLTGETKTVTITETVLGGAGTAPAENDVNMDVASVVLNTDDTDLIPVGARFTIAGETDTETVHIVTARTPASAGPTTNIVFSPALGAGSYGTGATLTFLPQRLEVKLGEGEAKWSKSRTLKYDLDRDRLDTVRQGADVPLDLSITSTWEHVRTGTGEIVTPTDAMDRVGGAAEWVSTGSECEPYAIDVEIVHEPECGAAQKETHLFPDYRYEKEDFDIKNATIATSGKCNVTAPTITRG